MARYIELYGCTFVVEGQGFVTYHAEADLEIAQDYIHDNLLSLSAERVREVYNAEAKWIKEDCAGPRPPFLDHLEYRAFHIATYGWANPNAVSVSISVLLKP